MAPRTCACLSANAARLRRILRYSLAQRYEPARPLLHATAEKTEQLEEPVRIETLTLHYTEQAVRFIERSKDSPFFRYMSHTYPHIPFAASERFRRKSPYGIYGDVVEELDWGVGQVLGALKKNWAR